MTCWRGSLSEPWPTGCRTIPLWNSISNANFARARAAIASCASPPNTAPKSICTRCCAISLAIANTGVRPIPTSRAAALIFPTLSPQFGRLTCRWRWAGQSSSSAARTKSVARARSYRLETTGSAQCRCQGSRASHPSRRWPRLEKTGNEGKPKNSWRLCAHFGR